MYTSSRQTTYLPMGLSLIFHFVRKRLLLLFLLSIGLCVAVVVASVVVFATVVVVVAGALIGGRNFKTFSFRVSLSVACSLCVLTCVPKSVHV